MNKSNAKSGKGQGAEEISRYLVDRVYAYAYGALEELKRRLDRRLVQTFFNLLLIILSHRHRNNGLLLSELGGYMLGMACAPAGTKRIANMLHSQKWGSDLIETWMWGTKATGR